MPASRLCLFFSSDWSRKWPEYFFNQSQSVVRGNQTKHMTENNCNWPVHGHEAQQSNSVALVFERRARID